MIVPSKSNAGYAPTACLLALLAVVGCGVATSALHAETTDEEFLHLLNVHDDPVDTVRLSKLFFGIAATLDGGKSSVRLLQTAISPRDIAFESVRSLVEGSFTDYSAAVGGFKSAVSDYLDEPDSPSLLFRVLNEGHHTCWRLDRHTRVIETYGASSADLMSVVSSSESCSKFRRAAFQNRISSLVADPLTELAGQLRENRELLEELNALERLLDDLREIDAAE